MFTNLILKIKRKPYAFARIKGSNDFPHINGIVYFYKVQEEVLISLQMKGLPKSDAAYQRLHCVRGAVSEAD